MTKASVIVDDAPIGTISPRLYGHFAEHLGRCCYGGLWLGPGKGPVPDVDGFRSDVVEALRELPAPLIRWPGGCYADHYHWRDGIGPPASRRTTLGMSCGLSVPDDQGLGTHEFLRLCELVGAEPYLVANLGSGSVQELCEWVEYVNTGAETSLTRERASNGRPEPWGVRLWGIGNETWGCGGRFDAATYALEYRRAATMVRHVDPQAELVAVGLEEDPILPDSVERDWNSKFLATLGPAVDLVDHLSVHRYWIRGGPEVGFGENDYYALLREAEDTEHMIERIGKLVAAAAQPFHPIGIAFDEWGVWHPEARDWGPGDVERRSPATFEQANTMRDALAVGIAFEGFHRQCRVLSMANLSQLVNVLQSPLLTSGATLVKTPTYHAFWLHRAHAGAEALQVEVDAEAIGPGVAALSATASSGPRGIAVTILNRDYLRPTTVDIRASGRASSCLLLAAESADSANDATTPERVVPGNLAFDSSAAGRCSVTLPPHSMATIEFMADRSGQDPSRGVSQD